MVKIGVYLFGLGFGVAMAMIIGKEIPREALSVLTGVAVGIASSIPVSLVIVKLVLRDAITVADLKHKTAKVSETPAWAHAQPNNVIVIDPSKLVSQPKGGLVSNGMMRTLPEDML